MRREKEKAEDKNTEKQRNLLKKTGKCAIIFLFLQPLTEEREEREACRLPRSEAKTM